MADKTLEMEVKSNIGEVAENTEKLGKATKEAQSCIKKLSASFSTLAKRQV